MINLINALKINLKNKEKKLFCKKTTQDDSKIIILKDMEFILQSIKF